MVFGLRKSIQVENFVLSHIKLNVKRPFSGDLGISTDNFMKKIETGLMEPPVSGLEINVPCRA